MPTQVTSAEFDQALERAETDLTEFGARIDTSVPDVAYSRAVIALGHRARALFLGFVALVCSEPVAAFVLLRPAVEINLTLRFLTSNPELHTELWLAEGEHEAQKLVRAIESDPSLAAMAGDVTVDEAWHRDKEQFVERARAAGLAARVKGVSKVPGKSVMPSMYEIAHSHGDEATRAAYSFAYRGLSPGVHSSSRAFDLGDFETAAEGRLSFNELLDTTHQVRRHRALNASTFASTLCVLSEPLEIDVLESAGMIRQVLASITTPEAKTA